MAKRELKPVYKSLPLAVLIDADNANSNVVDRLIFEAAKLCVASVKHIFCNLITPNLIEGKAYLLENSIQPIHQFRHTTRKNATDSTMIIDAIDLFYTGPLKELCIVSNDSDFTLLA